MIFVSPPSLSVVIPVYNSEKILPRLLERLALALLDITSQYEVIMVNDGSMDGSWQMICELSKRYPWLHGIDLMRNYGQHNALLCGIKKARNEVIVTIDDDLQNPPEEIRKLVSKILEGYDVVYGTPQREQHGFWRDRASQVTKIVLQGAMGAETARNVSAFRAFNREIRKALIDYRGSFVSIDVLLTWGAAKFTAIPVKHDLRAFGVSNYTLRKLVTHALNMMTGFSIVPLQIASLMGFAFSFAGIAVLIYVVGRYFIQGGSVPGFPFLASIIAIFSGAQLFSLGIIGEYLARMHFHSMGRPSSVIRDTVGYLSEEKEQDEHHSNQCLSVCHR